MNKVFLICAAVTITVAPAISTDDTTITQQEVDEFRKEIRARLDEISAARQVKVAVRDILNSEEHGDTLVKKVITRLRKEQIAAGIEPEGQAGQDGDQEEHENNEGENTTGNEENGEPDQDAAEPTRQTETETITNLCTIGANCLERFLIELRFLKDRKVDIYRQGILQLIRLLRDNRQQAQVQS